MKPGAFKLRVKLDSRSCTAPPVDVAYPLHRLGRRRVEGRLHGVDVRARVTRQQLVVLRGSRSDRFASLLESILFYLGDDGSVARRALEVVVQVEFESKV